MGPSNTEFSVSGLGRVITAKVPDDHAPTGRLTDRPRAYLGRDLVRRRPAGSATSATSRAAQNISDARVPKGNLRRGGSRTAHPVSERPVAAQVSPSWPTTTRRFRTTTCTQGSAIRVTTRTRDQLTVDRSPTKRGGGSRGEMAGVVVPRLWRGGLVTTSSDMAAKVPRIGVPCTDPPIFESGLAFSSESPIKLAMKFPERAVGGCRVDRVM